MLRNLKNPSFKTFVSSSGGVLNYKQPEANESKQSDLKSKREYTLHECSMSAT